jgi:signal recognition particle GTPase
MNYQPLIDAMEKRNFPISVIETAIGAIEDSPNQEETLKEIMEMIPTAQTPKEIVKMLQPIIKRHSDTTEQLNILVDSKLLGKLIERNVPNETISEIIMELQDDNKRRKFISWMTAHREATVPELIKKATEISTEGEDFE